MPATTAPGPARRLLLALVLAVLAAPAFAAETFRVGTSDQLARALSQARGGERIELADGSYGALVVANRRFGSPVTLAAANRRKARFDAVEITGTQGLALEGLHVESRSNGSFASAIVAVRGGRDISVTDCEVNGPVDRDFSGHYGLFTDAGAANVNFRGNYVHDVKNGGTFISTTGLKVIGNVVDRIGNDALKFLAVRDVLIEGNTGSRNVYPDPGAHLDFIQFQGGDSRDIVIRGNVFLPGTRMDVQGIFMDDAHYTNVLIERNVVVTGMLRGISVTSGTNVVARYNTVLDVPGTGSKATYVMVDGEAYGNIMATYPNDKHLGEFEGNLFLQKVSRGAPYHVGSVFRRGDAGAGITMEDLTPVPGSLASRYGATARR